MRKIKFTDWDRSTLEAIATQLAPSAVRMLDGQTLEPYCGSVPHEWNGETVEVFDCFEAKRLQRHHPFIYQLCEFDRIRV